jgi:hypothetical protein
VVINFDKGMAQRDKRIGDGSDMKRLVKEMDAEIDHGEYSYNS